jgi:2,3-bisphosphoglycerate-independent phosphoglycerate mutase
MSRPVVLCILDGWGLSDRREGNAPALAETPVMDGLMAERPHATLVTHGPDVGLPDGQMGNSEVGHTTIGAGRVIPMDLPRIDAAIEDGSFADLPALRRFAEAVTEAGGAAHLLGLASPGGVHSHQRHIAAAARALSDAGLTVWLHLVTDGRDVAPRSARDQLAALMGEVGALPGVRPATVMGRFFAMDRDRRWDRVERAHRAIRDGEGHRAADPLAAVDAAYARDETDEFMGPTVIGDYGGVEPGAGLLCANFRADRVREILGALLDPDFDGFERPEPAFSAALGMASYSGRLDALMEVAFPDEPIVNGLGEWVASHGLRQLRLAETEKYPHVTFFLNGGREEPWPGETRHMPPSPKVATYDLAPEMSAAEVTERLVAGIEGGTDLIVVNYANPDMVGHTGDLDAAMRACAAVDAGLGRALEALTAKGGAAVICADHGNCETMIAEDGGPHTAHTLNPVPVILVGGPEGARVRDGRLSDLAPTVLGLMGLDPPPEMAGRSLIG